MRRILLKVIPGRIIKRPPTAELRPNQKDTDSLPEYAVLDKIIQFVEEDKMGDLKDLGKKIGYDVIDNVLRLYKTAEFKRDQLPKGIKISRKAFGIGRRIPITNAWTYKCPRS